MVNPSAKAAKLLKVPLWYLRERAVELNIIEWEGSGSSLHRVSYSNADQTDLKVAVSVIKSGRRVAYVVYLKNKLSLKTLHQKIIQVAKYDGGSHDLEYKDTEIGEVDLDL